MKFRWALSVFLILWLFVSCSHTNNSIKDSAQSISPLLNGQMAPLGSLKNLKGERILLKDVLKTSPTVLVFYRGGWCPYCNLQLKGLRKVTKQIKKLGYQLIAISPDRPEEMVKSIGKQKLNYNLYSDSQLSVTKKFGLAFKLNEKTLKKYKKFGIDVVAASGEEHYSLPVPAVYILDSNGRIHFSYVNPDYKTRIQENILLSALKNLKLK